jgi:hypothetical protein
MNEWLNSPDQLVAVLACLGVLVLLVMLLWIRVGILSRRIKKLRAQYLQMMGETGVANLEEIILELKERLSGHDEAIRGHQAGMEQIKDALHNLKGHVGVVRYNAFGERGNDLSFSLAIVSKEQDGVVFTGLYGREETFVYAKPLQGGASPYPLTPEEREAINLALQRK